MYSQSTTVEWGNRGELEWNWCKESRTRGFEGEEAILLTKAVLITWMKRSSGRSVTSVLSWEVSGSGRQDRVSAGPMAGPEIGRASCRERVSWKACLCRV